MSDEERALAKMLMGYMEGAMDQMTERVGLDLANDMCNKIEDMAKESSDFAKRKVLLYTTIIDRLQKQVDNSCGTLKVE